MARISGQAKTRLIDEGFMNPATAWTNETQFGTSDPTTGRWLWNDQGLNCTVFELLNYAEVRYANTMTAVRSQCPTRPNNDNANILQRSLLCRSKTSPFQYGGLVPIIAIYEIDWATYDAQHGITPP